MSCYDGPLFSNTEISNPYPEINRIIKDTRLTSVTSLEATPPSNSRAQTPFLDFLIFTLGSACLGVECNPAFRDTLLLIRPNPVRTPLLRRTS